MPHAVAYPVAFATAIATVIGIGIGIGIAATVDLRLALLLALAPVAALAALRFGRSSPSWLVAFALALPLLVSVNSLSVHLGVGRFYISDAIVLLAVGHSVLGWARPRRRSPLDSSQVAAAVCFGMLTLLVGQAVLHGHEAYGTSLAGNATRLMLYALVVLLVTGRGLAQLETPLRVLLYAGTLVAAGRGLMLAAAGQTQTAASTLSTGGDRVLGLTTAMYAGMGLLLAVVMLTQRPNRRFPMTEWVVLAAGLLVQALAMGRASLGAIALAVVLLVAFSPSASRRALITTIAVVVPVFVLTFVVTRPDPPPIVSTLSARIFGTSTQDQNVQWRLNASDAAFTSFDEHLLFGVGFGRELTFAVEGGTGYLGGGDPHNGFVYLLTSAGVPAFVAFLALVALAFRRGFIVARRTAEDRTVMSWAMGALLLYLANVATEPYLSGAVHLLPLWLLLGVLLTTRRASTAPPSSADAWSRPPRPDAPS